MDSATPFCSDSGMEPSIARRVIFHACIVIWLGLMAGIPFIFVALGIMEGEVRAWRMAHLEGVLNGLVALAGVGVSRWVELEEPKQRILGWCLVLTGYCNVTASILGALSGQRGLVFTLPFVNLVVFTLFGVAIATIFAALYLLMRGVTGEEPS